MCVCVCVCVCVQAGRHVCFGERLFRAIIKYLVFALWKCVCRQACILWIGANSTELSR